MFDELLCISDSKILYWGKNSDFYIMKQEFLFKYKIYFLFCDKSIHKNEWLMCNIILKLLYYILCTYEKYFGIIENVTLFKFILNYLFNYIIINLKFSEYGKCLHCYLIIIILFN